MKTESRRNDFEERLLAELRSVVASQPAEGRRRRAWVEPRRRRLVLAGSVAVLLAAGAGAGVPFLSGGASPAYAVSRNDDGTVTVEISSLSDASGLQRRLREAGVSAVVQYLPPGKTCKEPWLTRAFEPAPASSPVFTKEIKGGVERTPDGQTRFTISKDLPPDDTLVIMTQEPIAAGEPAAEPTPTSIAVLFVQGDVGQCEIVDAPAGGQRFPLPPPPGAGLVQTTG